MSEIKIDGVVIQYEFNDKKDNCCVTDSYLITDKNIQTKFIQQVIMVCSGFDVRSVRSYVNEWRAHNFLYQLGLWKEHAKDVDLNYDEPVYRRIAYFILSIFYCPSKL